MGNIFGHLMTFLIIVGCLIWCLVMLLGGAELLWWIITGDFFHFVNLVVETVSNSTWG